MTDSLKERLNFFRGAVQNSQLCTPPLVGQQFSEASSGQFLIISFECSPDLLAASFKESIISADLL
jgi:hypothetical protein